MPELAKKWLNTDLDDYDDDPHLHLHPRHDHHDYQLSECLNLPEVAEYWSQVVSFNNFQR